MRKEWRAVKGVVSWDGDGNGEREGERCVLSRGGWVWEAMMNYSLRESLTESYPGGED